MSLVCDACSHLSLCCLCHFQCVSFPPSLYHLGTCDAEATSCSRDSDCPPAHYCGDCSTLPMGGPYYTGSGNMCRPCSSHPIGCPSRCGDDNTAFGDWPACSSCADIPGCAVPETCTTADDQLCVVCETGRYLAPSGKSCESCGNGGNVYACGIVGAFFLILPNSFSWRPRSHSLRWSSFSFLSLRGIFRFWSLPVRIVV